MNSIPFRCTNYIRLDTVPTPDELKQDTTVRDYLRTAPDYLLRDLWNIVASFLFDHTNIISITLTSLCGRGHDNSSVPYFYGREDGAEIEFTFNNLRLKASGHYPVPFCDLESEFRLIRAHKQRDDRFIFALSTQPLDPPKNPITFVWHKHYSQTFVCNEDADRFHKEHPDIPILRIYNGLLGRYDLRF